MTTPFLSIIIPVYNTEDKLERCVTSILNQQFDDYEILLIDDGSLDNSPMICDRFSEKYENIRVFHKPNGGVSSARNMGLKFANGEWVTFIDSDDYIGKDWYASFSKETEHDLIMQGFTFVDRESTPIVFSYKEATYTKNEIIKFILDYENTEGVPMRGPCNKFLRKNVLDQFFISFNEDVSCGEDYLFNLSYILHVRSIKVLPVSSYIYERTETGLALKKYRIEDYVDWQLKIMEALVNIADCLNDDCAKHYFYKEYSLNLTGYILNADIEKSNLDGILHKIEQHIEHFKEYVHNTRYAIVFLPSPFRHLVWNFLTKMIRVKRKIGKMIGLLSR